MKIPSWGKWVAVLMMVIGAFALYSDIESINPDNYDPDHVWAEMSQQEKGFHTPDSISSTAADSLESAQFSQFKKLMDLSDYLKTWMVRFAYTGILVNLLYILAGLSLFRLKPSSPKLVIAVLILSALNGIAQSVVFKMDEASNLMSSAIAFTPLVGVLVDVVLLVIVLNSDKDLYKQSAVIKQ